MAKGNGGAVAGPQPQPQMPQQQQQPKFVAVPVELVGMLVNYLAKRPFEEVALLLSRLQNEGQALADLPAPAMLPGDVAAQGRGAA